MEKFKEVLKVVLNRFKSPVVWAGIISIVGLVFTTAGYSLSDVGSWGELGNVVLSILKSPEKLAMIVVALFAFLNDASNREKF